MPMLWGINMLVSKRS